MSAIDNTPPGDASGASSVWSGVEQSGGYKASFEEHPLLQGAEDMDRWSAVDRISSSASWMLNPILIKEARQSLKSKQFTITFFLLLGLSWFWMIMGVTSLAPDIYYIPSGMSMLTGYYFLLAIPMMAMVPLAANRSLASEIDEGTFELLAITRLSSWRIITGKLGSALLQMMVYFAALVPSFAFCYLLRGVDLLMISTTIGLVFLVSLLLTSLGLLLATAVQNRAGQLLMTLALVGVITFAEFLCGAFVLDVLFEQEVYWTTDVICFTALFTGVGISFIALFLKAAAASIAPVTENRSTRLRVMMLVQQTMWVGSMATVTFWFPNDNDTYTIINIATMILAIYWLLMGSLMLAESVEMSPRVRRTLPKTRMGRMALMWFNPGPGTGFMFAICSGIGCIMSMSIIMTGVLPSSPRPFPPEFGMMMCGYLCFYLGLTRLISIPLCRAHGNHFVFPLSVLVGLLILGCAVPSVYMLITTGEPSRSFGAAEFTNWFWALEQAMERSTLHRPVSLLIAGAGAGVLLINMFFLFREFSYRRIAVPERVLEDEAQFQMGAET